MNTSFRFWPIFLVSAVLFAIHIPIDDANAQRGRRGGRGSGWEFVAKKYDADKDGTVTAEEYTRGAEGFKSLDTDGDGILSKKDWDSQTRQRGGSGDAPQVGDASPDFSLTEIRDAKKTVTLSDFAGKKPVALIFGSCT